MGMPFPVWPRAALSPALVSVLAACGGDPARPPVIPPVDVVTTDTPTDAPTTDTPSDVPAVDLPAVDVPPPVDAPVDVPVDAGTGLDATPDDTVTDSGPLDVPMDVSAMDAGGGGPDVSPVAPPEDAYTPPDGFVPVAHPPFPTLTPNLHAQLVPLRVVVILAPGEPLASQLTAFGDALVASTWLRTLDATYGLGAFPASVLHLTGPAMPTVLDFPGLQTYVHTLLGSHPEAAPDGHTLYLVFYPPGTSFPGGCFDYGAHWLLDDPGASTTAHDALAYVQRCTPPPGQSPLDYLTTVASHEVAESATDPNPPYGYALPTGRRTLVNNSPPWALSPWSYAQSGTVEDGDLCAGTAIREGDFSYQRIWSPVAAARGGDPCIPSLGVPYISASPATPWITVPAGTTTVVPITGWSTGPHADWELTVQSTWWSDNSFTASFPGGASTTPISHGGTVMLSVTAPPVAGAFTVYRLVSSDGVPVTTSTGLGFTYPPSGDSLHFFLFGVHTTAACSACPPPTPPCGDGVCAPLHGETCTTCPADCGACGSICGAANFSVTCPGGTCPTGSVCAPDGSCQCGPGLVATTCAGLTCTAGACPYPTWWCAPSTCGASDFTVPCGTGFCPASSYCTDTHRCRCLPGSQAATCTGTACPAGGCSYPNYWCTVCGNNNFTVTCPTGGHCPSFSACSPAGTCDCLPGYVPRQCDGTACPATGCRGAGWWCEPG